MLQNPSYTQVPTPQTVAIKPKLPISTIVLQLIIYIVAIVVGTIIITVANSILTNTLETTIQFIPTNVLATLILCFVLGLMMRVDYTKGNFRLFLIISILLSGYYSFNQVVIIVLLLAGILRIARRF